MVEPKLRSSVDLGYLPAIAVEKSSDKKLTQAGGEVSATWVSQYSCPPECPFLNKGCYAELGNASFVTKKRNSSTTRDRIKIAESEATAIRSLSGTRPLRLHVVGDCSSDKAAKIVSKAAEEYMDKSGQKVFTYTHSRRTKRESWGRVSVLRSCENLEQVDKAKKAGFASALVVSEFEKDTSYLLKNGMKGMPCPQQTGKAKDCFHCRACMNDDKLRDGNVVVLFKAHGAKKKSMKESLEL